MKNKTKLPSFILNLHYVKINGEAQLVESPYYDHYELCNDKGWILTMNLNLLQWTIEKCDECDIFPNDEAAGDQANAELV